MTKTEYYKELAQYYAASTYLHRVDSVVMMENMHDEWFWRQVLEHYKPQKYEFVAGTQSQNNGNVSTGCGQCLKYRGFLNQRFFVCMDSDIRYLRGENITVTDGFIQTYTYSWENHCAYFERLGLSNLNFDFTDFLYNFSNVVHRGLMFLMHVMNMQGTDFTPQILRGCISQQFRKGDEIDSGKAIIQRIENHLEVAMRNSVYYDSFDYEAMTAEFIIKGVTQDNAYLYVRGHNVYSMLNSIGSKLFEGNDLDFEDSVLKSAIIHYNYPEIHKVGTDIALL